MHLKQSAQQLALDICDKQQEHIKEFEEYWRVIHGNGGRCTRQ